MTRKWGMHLSTSVFPTVKDNWLRRLAKSWGSFVRIESFGPGSGQNGRIVTWVTEIDIASNAAIHRLKVAPGRLTWRLLMQLLSASLAAKVWDSAN
jgi:hypothetical protein